MTWAGQRPEVEVLRHINLFEDIHQTCLLRWFVYFVIERNWQDVSAFAVIDIVAAEESDNRTLRDEDHVPAGRELDEAYDGSM